MHFAAGQGLLQGLPVHPGHHQHGAIKPVLGHGGNQPGLVEPQNPQQSVLLAAPDWFDSVAGGLG